MKAGILRGLGFGVFCFFTLAASGTMASGGVSQYFFTYSYNDGSGDKYYGYVYAPDGLLPKGSKIYNQPAEKGGAALGGYYEVTGVTTGAADSYNKQEYITSFYDADTGKTSTTLYTSLGQKRSDQPLVVADRCLTAESGYVYDPSVPSADAYFGDSDVCYSFSTSKSNANFLAAYITDLPYWDQPDSYPGSCAEVAGAIYLAYWTTQGYSSLLPTNWETNWPSDTANASSYVSLIKQLATDMNWSSYYGTYLSDVGSGLVTYAGSINHGGYSFDSASYDIAASRSSSWTSYKTILDSGRPVIDFVAWSAGGHAVIDRGYWNDGHMVEDFGWGSSYGNVKLNWYATRLGYTYDTACLFDYVYFYPSN